MAYYGTKFRFANADLLCYLTLRADDLSDLQLGLDEEFYSLSDG